MTGIVAILICWVVGNFLSLLIRGFVSGNIIGMLLLYAALHFKVIKADKVAPTAKFLLGTMALFFVPYGVGLMESYDILAQNWVAVTVAAVVSTLLVMAVAAFIYIKLRK
jgi:holin-like protein